MSDLVRIVRVDDLAEAQRIAEALDDEAHDGELVAKLREVAQRLLFGRLG